MTPTQIESAYPPEVVAAWHWLDINCRHYATPNSDIRSLMIYYNATAESIAALL